MKRIATAIAVVALAAGITACGGGDEVTPQDVSDAMTEGVPECSDVIVEGEALPDDYDGCKADGDLMGSAVYDCKDGSEFVMLGDYEPRAYTYDYTTVEFAKGDEITMADVCKGHGGVK